MRSNLRYGTTFYFFLDLDPILAIFLNSFHKSAILSYSPSSSVILDFNYFLIHFFKYIIRLISTPETPELINLKLFPDQKIIIKYINCHILSDKKLKFNCVD